MILTNTQKMLDTSSELRVLRSGNGIKLVRPDQMKADTVDAHISVGELVKLPFCVYFFDPQSISKNVNDPIAELGGYGSIHDALNKSVLDYIDRESCLSLLSHSKQVMDQKHTMSFDESGYCYLINKHIDAISIKMPWFNSKNQVVGLLGFSIVSGTDSLSSSMNTLIDLGLLNNSNIPEAREIENVILTAREKVIAEYLMRECTSKEIARCLFISPRTVESHVDNMKAKLNVNRKEGLIEKLQRRFT